MHWLSVDKTSIQRRTICDKDYDSDSSIVDVMEDDDVSFSMDDDLVGMGEGSTDDKESFLSCASKELDVSESDSSENSDESDNDNDDGNDNDDCDTSRSNSDMHLAKRQ
jgi:hypothetical protein